MRQSFGTYRKSFSVIFCILSLLIIYISCNNNDVNIDKHFQNVNGDTYAGSVACAKCHSSIYADFTHTAHFRTSSLPIEKNIKGRFINGENIFLYDYSTFMLMEKKNDQFYQTEYKSGKQERSESIYIVIGSGTRGQSYLYRKGSQLFQLPISYFTNTNSWSNSPGFPFFQPMFSRTITSRCLECHSTFVDMKEISEPNKDGKPENMIFGVSCESCHGPAEKHVEFQEQHPANKLSMYILNPAKFTREQKIEICGYCHMNGKVPETAKPFTFTPGGPLNKYLISDMKADTSNVDVHGNQVALLKASKCFKFSKLDCNTCHNTHQQERNNITLFSNRCMNCHNEAHNSFCKLTVLSKNILKNNCIDCHMPAKQSKILTVNLNQTNIKTPAVIRSHFITIYPEETKKFIQKEIQHSSN